MLTVASVSSIKVIWIITLVLNRTVLVYTAIKRTPVPSAPPVFIGAKNGTIRVGSTVSVGINDEVYIQGRIFSGEVKTFTVEDTPFVSVITVPSFVTFNQKTFLSFPNSVPAKTVIGNGVILPIKTDVPPDVSGQGYVEKVS